MRVTYTLVQKGRPVRIRGLARRTPGKYPGGAPPGGHGAQDLKTLQAPHFAAHHGPARSRQSVDNIWQCFFFPSVGTVAAAESRCQDGRQRRIWTGGVSHASLRGCGRDSRPGFLLKAPGLERLPLSRRFWRDARAS